jgi:urease accessory protein
MVGRYGAGALLLQVWTSPAFPVGSFAYSHAIEWAVEQGDIHDASTLRAWLADLVAHGGARSEALLMGSAWRAANAEDTAELCVINELALALANSRERYLETTAQGNAFLAAARAAWDCPGLERLAQALTGDVAYPVVSATACAGHDIALMTSLEAFGLAFMANLVSAAVRLGAIGQTDGQKVTAATLPDVHALAAFAAQASLDDLGGAAYRSDLAALQHETQYSRLFRS